MEFILNKQKYSDRTLTDEQIEHRISYNEMYKHSMSEMLKNSNYNENDKRSIEKNFEKRFW